MIGFICVDMFLHEEIEFLKFKLLGLVVAYAVN